MHNLQTLRDWLRYGACQMQQAQLFFGHGTDNAWDEMAALITATIHLPFERLEWALDTHLTTDEQKQIAHLLEQRIKKRIPLPYLTHQAWFAGLEFYVDERVLIPRSPIAELIQKQFSPWIAASQVQRILDIGTGSGCIAIACAYAFPDAEVDAIDCSKDALIVAAKNVEKHEVDAQVSLLESDLWHALSSQRYDVIVANPPYVSAAEMAALPAEYHHEPKLALASGAEGLDCADKILQHAAQFLTPHGILFLEVGASQTALQARYPNAPFVWLDFEHGEDGVLVCERQALESYF